MIGRGTGKSSRTPQTLLLLLSLLTPGTAPGVERRAHVQLPLVTCRRRGDLETVGENRICQTRATVDEEKHTSALGKSGQSENRPAGGGENQGGDRAPVGRRRTQVEGLLTPTPAQAACWVASG